MQTPIAMPICHYQLQIAVESVPRQFNTVREILLRINHLECEQMSPELLNKLRELYHFGEKGPSTDLRRDFHIDTNNSPHFTHNLLMTIPTVSIRYLSSPPRGSRECRRKCFPFFCISVQKEVCATHLCRLPFAFSEQALQAAFCSLYMHLRGK